MNLAIFDIDSTLTESVAVDELSFFPPCGIGAVLRRPAVVLRASP
jgi:hypothetical protein